MLHLHKNEHKHNEQEQIHCPSLGETNIHRYWVANNRSHIQFSAIVIQSKLSDLKYDPEFYFNNARSADRFY